MNKLTKWYIDETTESFGLGGFAASDSERFLTGTYVFTSQIETVEVDESGKNFIFHTMSGSEYVCSFEDIEWTSEFAEDSRDNLERLHISRAFTDEAIKLAGEKENALVERLGNEFSNGDLYLEMGAGGIIDVHFKYMDVVHRISCRVNVGMFQNSYLYCLLDVVDFRHFEFSGGSVDTYHMSDSIKRLVVDNIGSSPVTIDHKVYESGITVTCITEENHPEGLFSPDSFNGKSLLFHDDFMKDTDEPD